MSAVKPNIQIPVFPPQQPTLEGGLKTTLEGGLTFCDKTNGIAKVVFSQKLSDEYHESTYQVFIHGKKLTFPTSSNPTSDISIPFTGSKKISVRLIRVSPTDEIIKIKEKRNEDKTFLYIDPKHGSEGFYDAYSYIPKELSLAEALKKIENIKTDIPHFKGDMAVYNRHGVAVFGWDESREKYVLCWANPNEEKVQMKECSLCDRSRDGGSSHAKSKDGKVNFKYIYSRGYFLNAEPATTLSLRN